MSSSGSDKPRVPPPPLLRKPLPPPVALPRPAPRKQAAEVDIDVDVEDTPSPEQRSRTAPGFPSRPRDAAPSSNEDAPSGHAPTLLALPSDIATLLDSSTSDAKRSGDAEPQLDVVPEAPTFTPPPETTPRIDGHAEDVDMSARELDVLFEGEAEAEEAVAEQAPPKLKHALPRPKPSKSKASEFATSTRRPTPPPMSGNVPKGIRPPSSRPVLKPEDTQMIIAALGAAMIDEEPAAGESMNAPTAPAAATSSVQRVSPPVAILDDEDFEPRAKQPPWLWIAVGAIAAVLIAMLALSWGDDDGAAQAPEQSPAYSGAAMSAENDKEHQPVVKARREAPTPATPTPVPAEEVAKEAPAELAVADAEEVEEVEEIAEVEEAVPAEIEPPPPAAAEPTTAPVASAQHNKRNKHRSRHQPQQGAVSSAAPPPASAPASKASSSAKGEPGADELLAQAKRALSSGSNSAAYTLAAKSRRLKKTTDALQIMAKAGCRLGSENKAKAAFAQLPFGMKAGIRSECRAKGIRLGL